MVGAHHRDREGAKVGGAARVHRIEFLQARAGEPHAQIVIGRDRRFVLLGDLKRVAEMAVADAQKQLNVTKFNRDADLTTGQATLDMAKLAAQTPLSDADLASFYNQHREDFRQQEEVKASHVLVKTEAGPDGKVDPKVDAAARAKARGNLPWSR